MDGSIGPMELPTRMQYRFREINKILKQTVYLVPNNGQADVNAGDSVSVLLPLENLLWAKLRDYTVSRVNPNPRRAFLMRVL